MGTDIKQKSAPKDVQQVQLAVQQQMVALPVPPPALIAQYKELYSDAPKKFFQWVEDESVHRREIEDRLVQSKIGDSRLGLWLGFIIAVFALLVAGFAAYIGQTIVAVTIGGASLAALATTFIVGSRIISRTTMKK